jgi:DDE superfamily endonuclease/Helix-turn-helix of DDE superfamily endonuclease
MVTYSELAQDRRRFLALTGLTTKEFQILLSAFRRSYDRLHPPHRTLNGQPRQRRAGGGRHGVLHPLEQKLLFLLVYLKTYPLQVLLGELFDLSQQGVNYWLQRLLPVLLSALDELGVRPERNPGDFPQSQPRSRKGHRLVIDATERRRQRPKNPEKQALFYSGKKKTHTNKNVVIVNAPTQRVEFLSQTYPGKTHEKKIADREAVAYPPGTVLYKDTGFQGYEPLVKETCQPKKKDTRKEADPSREANQAKAVEDTRQSRTWYRRGEKVAHRQGHVPKYQRG